MQAARSVASWIYKALVLALLLSLVGCAWLDGQQRRLIYRPTPAASAATPALEAGGEAFFLPADAHDHAAQIALWWLPHTNPQAPTLLYLHGTFRNLEGNRPKIDALRQAGFSVLAVDYRGWGHSTPITPSEQTIAHDARLAWAELVRREPRAGMRVIYGHSMGSGVAVALASSLQSPGELGAVVLESAFTSFQDIAAKAGFWAGLLSRLTGEQFASIDKIARVKAPILMLHGDRDTTVPMVLGQQLFAAVHAPKQWVTFAGGGHSDLHRQDAGAYQQAISAFMARYLLQPK